MIGPGVCTFCGGRVVPVEFGMPTDSTFEAAERGEVILGGCSIPFPTPERRCAECGHEWGAPDEHD